MFEAIQGSDPLWRAMDLKTRTYLSDAEEQELAELLEEYRLDEEPRALADGGFLQTAAA